MEEHQSTNEQFYKSNFFRKLSNLANNNNNNQSYSNDMPSMIIRPDS